MSASLPSAASVAASVALHRDYVPFLTLKYGVNPNQQPALLALPRATSDVADAAQSTSSSPPAPFRVLHGVPGYINLLDALNSWQLVRELKEATGLTAAASFKHVSPAGAAVAVPLSPALSELYDAGGLSLTPAAVAYLRARQTDPKCSFGDWAALSDEVDEATALFLKREVSDGIIAPSFTAAALDILRHKKGGAFIVLQAEPGFRPPAIEYRELYGACFIQQRNASLLNPASFSNIVTADRSPLPASAVLDLLVASITAKYTQSNSVVYAKDGQTIGVGAGQQSRVDCVKLAGSKAEVWWLRQHPRVRQLAFREDVKRVERVNARIAFIEGDMSEEEWEDWRRQLQQPDSASPLTAAERAAWLRELSGVSLCSDAFFPFADNVHQAARRGVAFIAQAGGSVQDKQVIAAADKYSIKMAFTGVRLFHH
jgi:phosphoribosylaminoimidazolecarboxamide formyltransferase/IMP cyclohydrolase